MGEHSWRVHEALEAVAVVIGSLLFSLAVIALSVAPFIGCAWIILDSDSWHIGLFLILLPVLVLAIAGYFDEKKRSTMSPEELEAEREHLELVAKSEAERKERERQEREAKLERLKAEAAERRQAVMDRKNPTICPKCRSRNTEILGTTDRASFGRAVIGGAIAGPAGAVVGAATGKKQRHEFVCRDCGNRWIVK